MGYRGAVVEANSIMTQDDAIKYLNGSCDVYTNQSR